MGAAVIDLAFDPIVRLGDFEIRAQTVVLIGILVASLLVWARIGHLTPQPGPYVPPPPLRLDDIPFLILGIVPGAVLGGRLEYVLIHADYYQANPSAIVDPAQGSLSLGFAVLGGLVGGAVIARLIGAPAERWMHAGTLPLLFALAAGKIASVLAAEGQGLPSDAPWATAYLGAGPWASLAPEVAAHPAQVYEAIVATLTLAVLVLMLRAGAFGRRDGSALLTGIGLWAVGRFIVAFTWRDVAVAGPFRAEHLVLAVVIGACVGGLLRLRRQAGSGLALRRRTTA